ncbi:MAG TPA: flavin reductase family protein [Ktedonobacteraceae bacterium]|nr:flavin reductase family protein [Ktedonobacteraceae bacterium]
MSFTPSDFRTTMARFATGVTVVTTRLDHACFGLTVNAFCSVSLNPPLILVSLDLTSQTYAAICRSGVFAVNVLTQEQEQLALRFARKDLQSKTFGDIPLHTGGTTGVPLFAEALARIECRVAHEYPGGDHALVLGEVVSVDYCDDRLANEPLLYYRSTFWVNPQERAVSKLPASTRKPASGRGEERNGAEVSAKLPAIELVPLPFVFSFEA